MSFKIVALLALSTAVLAHPQRHHHHYHGTGASDGGLPMPTGGPFSIPNATESTGSDAFGAGSSSVTVATLTVSPIPASDMVPNAATIADSGPTAGAAIGGNSEEVDATSPTTSCTSTTMTTTVTSMDYATVTVTGDDSTPSSAPAEDFAPPSSSSTTQAPTVVAGAFYGGPSYGGGFSFGSAQSSSAAPSVSLAPTSFLTSASTALTFGSVSSSVMSSLAPSASSTPPSGGTSGGKKGLSYNEASLTDAFSGDGVTWAYNWGSSSGGSILSGAEYVPMLWGSGQVSGWSSAVQAAVSSGSSHVLSFNEPDLTSQSNLTPQHAAQLHIANMGNLGSVQVGSPAVTNGDSTSPPMGTNWLTQFFQACNGQCKVDFVAFHYYADTDLPTFQSYVTNMISVAQQNGVSEVWLTEFGATGSDSDVATFISSATSWLDQQSAVGRYAYFMCGDGTLLSGSSLSTLGEAYAA